MWAVSRRSCLGFLSESGDRVSPGGQSCPDSREVRLRQLWLCFSLKLFPPAPCPHRQLLSASLGELSISCRCCWALIPAMGRQRRGAALGVLHGVGGGRAQGVHLSSQSLDFLTYKTSLSIWVLCCLQNHLK